MKNKYEVLKEYFNYDNFIYPQDDLIDKILEHKDVLGILPTGFGKSIIYQVAGLMFDGITLIVCPLIALMKDQVDNLKKRGIKACYISSNLSKYERDYIINNLNDYKFIYISPERLSSEFFLKALPKISLLVIDEAHTLRWGESFRALIKNVRSFIINIKPRPVVACFTATADKYMIKYIKYNASLINPYIKWMLPLKENIMIKVIKKNRFMFLENMISKKIGKIIIYCATCKMVEYLFNYFNKNNDVFMYHGKMSKDEKDFNQDKFKNSSFGIMFATSAFGTGLDIRDIRVVILYDLPLSLNDLVQEIGRAGRDKFKAYAYVCYSKESIKVNSSLILSGLDQKEAKKEFNEVIKFCFSKDLLGFLKMYYS